MHSLEQRFLNGHRDVAAAMYSQEYWKFSLLCEEHAYLPLCVYVRVCTLSLPWSKLHEFFSSAVLAAAV